ncbi:VIER F-box protein 2, partial [Tanacetum coccineum]
MTKLTQKKVKFDRGDKQEAAFQLLKEKLCSAPILALPEGAENFVVYCDASHKGLCAILMQNDKVIAYASRQLKIHEKKMHANGLELELEYGVSNSTEYGSSPSNTSYLSQQINTVMTKVIKGEFEKIKDVKVEDVSLTCDTSLEIFNMEVSRLSGMDNDLFTYKVKVANIPCNSVMDDDLEDETENDMGIMDLLGSERMMKLSLTDEGNLPSDDEDEIAEVDPDLLTKDITGFKTYDDHKNDWIYEWIKDVPWVDEKPWTDTGVWTEPKPVKHTCEPFNYKTGCWEWPTCSWKEDGYCNGGNLPKTYIIENPTFHYQDYEWYEALDDCELKEEALRNKAIMDRVINDDESRCELKRKWIIYTNYDDAYEINHEDTGNKELCEIHGRVLYKVEDIVTYLVEFVKFWDDWEVDYYENANL